MTMPEVQKLAKSLGIEGKLAGKGVTKRLLIQKVKDKQNKTLGVKPMRFPCKHKLPELYNETLFNGTELDKKCVLSTGNSRAKVYWHVPEKSFCCKIPTQTETQTQQQKRFHRVIHHKLSTVLAPEVNQCAQAFVDVQNVMMRFLRENGLSDQRMKPTPSNIKILWKVSKYGGVVFKESMVGLQKMMAIIAKLMKYATIELLPLLVEWVLQWILKFANSTGFQRLLTCLCMYHAMVALVDPEAVSFLLAQWGMGVKTVADGYAMSSMMEQLKTGLLGTAGLGLSYYTHLKTAIVPFVP